MTVDQLYLGVRARIEEHAERKGYKVTKEAYAALEQTFQGIAEKCKRISEKSKPLHAFAARDGGIVIVYRDPTMFARSRQILRAGHYLHGTFAVHPISPDGRHWKMCGMTADPGLLDPDYVQKFSATEWFARINGKGKP